MALTPIQQEGAFAADARRTINSNLVATRAVAYAKYNFAVDGGAVATITPAINDTIPINAIITNVIIDFTTAVTSGGSATVAIGTSAGSSTTALLGATAKASCTGLVQATPVPQTASTFVKLTAAGQITVTVATAALTAGVCEIFVEYSPSST